MLSLHPVLQAHPPQIEGTQMPNSPKNGSSVSLPYSTNLHNLEEERHLIMTKLSPVEQQERKQIFQMYLNLYWRRNSFQLESIALFLQDESTWS